MSDRFTDKEIDRMADIVAAESAGDLKFHGLREHARTCPERWCVRYTSMVPATRVLVQP